MESEEEHKECVVEQWAAEVFQEPELRGRRLKKCKVYGTKVGESSSYSRPESGLPKSALAGGDFTAHVMIVQTSEDVGSKIASFSPDGPRSVCVLSATGELSSVVIGPSNSSDGTSIRYEACPNYTFLIFLTMRFSFLTALVRLLDLKGFYAFVKISYLFCSTVPIVKPILTPHAFRKKGRKKESSSSVDEPLN
ncbi:hypothetical protein CJ030_MR1G000265 [Morella rubra]|uniref:AT-hook motif nuclear-localized protein n=1 Tax=Morella rubra TaxID=262757 RepID=A0A6A1WPV5_9ROSI|nr:hypothetical protein CJ030_MR1G000265 [Morella rubra]